MNFNLGHCFSLGLSFIIKQGFLGTLLMAYLGVSDSTIVFSLLKLRVLMNFWHLSVLFVIFSYFFCVMFIKHFMSAV